MNQVILNSATAGIVLSLIAFETGSILKKKWKLAILNPLLIAIILVICFMGIFHVDYKSYHESAKYLSYLLTPATVCLAIPMYRQRELLKRNIVPVVGGIATGVFSSLLSILILSKLFGLTQKMYITLLPKSITTAIGMGISEELGGYVNISVAIIIVTGVIGNVIADTVFRLFHIKDPISRGLAIGASSHAIGTARAMEMGEVEGAMSSLAIVSAGLGTVVGVIAFSRIY